MDKMHYHKKRQNKRAITVLASTAELMAAIILVGCSSPALAANHSEDDAAIRAQANEYSQAFGTAAIDKLSDYWEDSAVFIDQSGNVFHGRGDLKRHYTEFFGRYGAQPLEITIESIAFPADNIAIEQGTTRLKNSSAASAMARYVATHVKHDGKWFMESVSESPYIAASNGEYLKPLAWLIGSWQAEGPNGNLHLKAEWANKNVLQLNLEVKSTDGSKLAHSEFIYWNPQTQNISSWMYDVDGGTSRKIWDKIGENWVVHAVSIQADGSQSNADYIYKQIDNDTFSWQSKRRSLDGVELPDTEQLKVTRVRN